MITKAAPKEKFCANCGALLINQAECSECAPYERMVLESDIAIDMLRKRRSDATTRLVELKQARAKAIDKAILIN